MVTNVNSDVSVEIEPRVAVVGVGGAGCNIISGLYESLAPVDTIAINTDKLALQSVHADTKIFICKAVTKGEGTRGDAGLGKKCAQVHEDEIEKALVGYDAVFIVAGLGGGTGTGAAPVIAEICNRINLMTFVIAVNPFSFESSRSVTAVKGIRAIKAVCPSVFTIENDLVLNYMSDATMSKAMSAVNDSIKAFVIDAVEMMPGLIGLEIDKVVSTMKHSDRSDIDQMPKSISVSKLTT